MIRHTDKTPLDTSNQLPFKFHKPQDNGDTCDASLSNPTKCSAILGKGVWKFFQPSAVSLSARVLSNLISKQPQSLA